MERMFEKDVIPMCEELGIGFVAFNPLANGFLSGKYTADTQYTGFDARRVITRFSRENVLASQPLLDVLTDFANQKDVTPAQISLAWMLHKKEFIVPIPGSRTPERGHNSRVDNTARIIFKKKDRTKPAGKQIKID